MFDGADDVDRLVAHWKAELPSLDADREQVVMRIQRIAGLLMAEGQLGAADDGLTMWQFKTLLMLRRGGPPYESSPSMLGELLGVTRSAVTSRLDWLYDLGLVVREGDAHDRRRVVVRLTEAGNAAVERVASSVDAREAALFKELTSDELRELSNLLRKVLAAAARP